MILAALLKGFTVAMLVGTGVEQTEVDGPKRALENEGAIVHLVAPSEGKVRAWDCYALEPKDELTIDVPLSKAKSTDYDALVIPGGLHNDDQRIDEIVLSFVRGFANKPISSICHGQLILINAGLVKNKTLTSFPTIQIDLENAGAKWVNKPIVKDGNLLTSRMRDDVPVFSEATVAFFSEFAPKQYVR